jgi:hypothetical protein
MQRFDGIFVKAQFPLVGTRHQVHFIVDGWKLLVRETLLGSWGFGDIEGISICIMIGIGSGTFQDRTWGDIVYRWRTGSEGRVCGRCKWCGTRIEVLESFISWTQRCSQHWCMSGIMRRMQKR